MDKIKYVNGFLFSPDYKKIVLIRKNRPEFQAGRLNGIGGRIEQNETSADAMKREFIEEAGLEINDWKHFVTLTGDTWEVDFYFAVSEDYHSVTSKTDEIVEIHYVFNVPNMEVMSHLKWLIPMSMDKNVVKSVVYSN